MTGLRALLVDDERPARRWLAKLLADHPAIEVVGEADDVYRARELVEQLQPDVVFLDVQMPPATGFDLLPHLPAVTQVILVTAFDSFAVKAFEANALDYLVKPVHPDRLAHALQRLQARQAGAQERGHIAADPHSPLQLEDLLPLRDRDLLRMIQVQDIAIIQAEGAYTRITIADAQPMMVLCPISDWEMRLPAPPFARLDRSRIINLSKVTEAVMKSRNQTSVALSGVDDALVLGRAASLRLRQLLG